MFHFIQMLINNTSAVVPAVKATVPAVKIAVVAAAPVAKVVADTVKAVASTINIDSTANATKSVLASLSGINFFKFLVNVKFIVPIVTGICVTVEGLKEYIKGIKEYVTVTVAIVLSMIVAFIVGHYNNFSVIQSIIFGALSALLASGGKALIEGFLAQINVNK